MLAVSITSPPDSIPSIRLNIHAPLNKCFTDLQQDLDALCWNDRWWFPQKIPREFPLRIPVTEYVTFHSKDHTPSHANKRPDRNRHYEPTCSSLKRISDNASDITTELRNPDTNKNRPPTTFNQRINQIFFPV